jgi:hypothetical protein
MNKIILALLISLFSTSLLAKSYSCMVSQKLDSENVYTQEMIDKYKFEVKINDNGSTAILSRCSFESSANAVTCDEYNVDKIERDSIAGISKSNNLHRTTAQVQRKLRAIDRKVI